jgi:hypothetical protein
MAGDARAKELCGIGDALFSKKAPLDSLNQEIAENFYPERADFTRDLSLGQEYAEHLMDSYPVMMRRELGNNLSAMLRPKDKPWFAYSTLSEDRDQRPENAAYLEYLTKTHRTRLYDARCKFVRATKRADHDYATFGYAILSVQEAPSREHIIFKDHHPKNIAILENDVQEIDHLHERGKMSARSMVARFGSKNVHATVKKAAEKEPGKEFNVRTIVMPAEEYDLICRDGKGKKIGKSKHPFVCLYLDSDNQHILKETSLPIFPYVVPRWHTITGSPYAFSPAAMVSLPDARLAQAMAGIILEAGEKSIDPPLAAIAEVVRSADIRAGAISWIDAEYDGKVSDAIQPMPIKGDMNTGFAMRQDLREMLSKAWFVDRLTLPEAGREMTAFEVGRRLEEHIRGILPLFEPIEQEYNTPILEKSFQLLANMQVFDFSQMPDDLAEENLSFRFKNPMQEASERVLVQQYQEVLQILEAAKAAGVKANPINLETATRDAIRGTGAPAKWGRTDDEIAAEAEQMAEAEEEAMMLQEVMGAAQAAGAVGDAGQKITQALAPPQGQKALPPPRKALPAPRAAA